MNPRVLFDVCWMFNFTLEGGESVSTAADIMNDVSTKDICYRLRLRSRASVMRSQPHFRSIRPICGRLLGPGRMRVAVFTD